MFYNPLLQRSGVRAEGVTRARVTVAAQRVARETPPHAADLAQRSGVAETTINRIERGHHEPRFSTVRKLATALDVAAATLMDSGEEEAKLAA
jgi:transcriptional regulator with XRE-family HTH domain